MNYDIKYKPSKCHNVCVWTFLPEPLRKINVQHYQDKILVRDLLTAVAQTLGIFKENIQYFAIFEGSLLNPSEKLDESDILDLPCKKLHSMQKWSFDIYGEKRALKTDMAALKLVRWQALSDIQEGRLKPSPDQIEKLDEVGSFVVENQLMSIIYSVQDYGAVIIEHCQVISELTIPQLCLARREYVKIQLDLKGLTLVTGTFKSLTAVVNDHLCLKHTCSLPPSANYIQQYIDSPIQTR